MSIEFMIGKVFGDLTVLKYSHSLGGHRFYECICLCGQTRTCKGYWLKEGRAKRCFACKGKHLITHGMTNSSTYYIWKGMRARCENPNARSYKNYGARGISVCKRWLIFDNFLEDMGIRPDGLQIDRIDNEKGYSKENCRWVTPRENNLNKRKNYSLKEGSSESKSAVVVIMEPTPNSTLVPERKTNE